MNAFWFVGNHVYVKAMTASANILFWTSHGPVSLRFFPLWSCKLSKTYFWAWLEIWFRIICMLVQGYIITKHIYFKNQVAIWRSQPFLKCSGICHLLQAASLNTCVSKTKTVDFGRFQQYPVAMSELGLWQLRGHLNFLWRCGARQYTKPSWNQRPFVALLVMIIMITP